MLVGAVGPDVVFLFCGCVVGWVCLGGCEVRACRARRRGCLRGPGRLWGLTTTGCLWDVESLPAPKRVSFSVSRDSFSRGKCVTPIEKRHFFGQPPEAVTECVDPLRRGPGPGTGPASGRPERGVFGQ